ncbi:hypothetical protein [Actinomyces oris]|uniref:DUF3558 domain-containing protein n=1 Tax=Actinomyces oris TaxID=544580 RepID=A0AAW9KJ37_9ACTO|nr:hypothetical protein [Actinomyces oris]MEA1305080.1 hypothetical protein [Actinomyces oris]
MNGRDPHSSPDGNTLRTQRQSPARAILALLLAVTLLVLIGVSWHLLGSRDDHTRKKMPDLTVPSIIPSGSAQTCSGIPDRSVQALLGSYGDDLTYDSVHLQNYTTCTIMNSNENILRIVYGHADSSNVPSDKIATEKNGAKPVVLQSAPQGHGLVNSTDSANAELVYQRGQGQFISITIRGYVLGTPVESNLINMANSISSLACTT